MEIRALKYLRAVAHEGNVTNAARSLHMTQPTLSRQLAALEDELGCELFTRSHRGIALNDQGAMLLRYAESILDLVEKAHDELAASQATVSGSVHIGAGETTNMTIIAEAMELTHARFPSVDFQIHSGASVDLMDGFARGAYDFLIECEVRPHVEANVLELPIRDRWGILVARSSPLAEKECVVPADLIGHPLIVPRQAIGNGTLVRWAGECLDAYDVRASFNLPLNASFLARHGLGAHLTYEGLIETNRETALAFVPLSPELTSTQGIVWRKMTLSKPAHAFLEALRETIEAHDGAS